MSDSLKNNFYLSDQELKLILEMIEGGTFSGQGVELVASLKASIKIELDARARETNSE